MQTSLTADRPAASDRAVVFACDANYLPMALHAAAQLAALHPARDFDICLATMDDPLALPPSLAPLGLRAVRIEAHGAFDDLKTDRRRTASAYLRLALPGAFAADYRRLLYLDSDVFVQGGDVSALLRAELRGRPLAAVRDTIQWRTPSRRPEAFRILGLPHARYFNSGLMLMDLDAILARDLPARCLTLARGEGRRLPGHDQNLLNATLHGDWAELSPVWNWQDTWATRLFETLVDPHIVHFIGSKKPWSPKGRDLPPRWRRSYARFFAEHLPERALPPEPAPRLPATGDLARLLLKHLVSARRMAAYLDRFESDLAVLA